MFVATNFAAPSVFERTRNLKRYFLDAAVPYLFGMVPGVGEDKSLTTTIAFGHMVGGVKTRMGSVSTLRWHDGQKEMLVISIDNQHEYRSDHESDIRDFLRQLASHGNDWEKASDAMLFW